MLKRRHTDTSLDPALFATFNQELFQDPLVEPATFRPLSDTAAHRITPHEVLVTLLNYFKADKSSGSSPLPLQLLKYIGKDTHETLAHFLSDSAVN
jgi:hypothetical protein